MLYVSLSRPRLGNLNRLNVADICDIRTEQLSNFVYEYNHKLML